MITVNFMGRLGNQLFQFAAAYAYALRWKVKLFLPPQSQVTPLIPSDAFEKMDGKKVRLHKEPALFKYAPIPKMSSDEIVCLDGYFQSEKYFSDFSSQVRELLLPESKRKPPSAATSLHVRRGDYLYLSYHHPVLGIEYYQEALERLGNPTEVWVFSDDIPWCKSVFKGPEFKFMEAKSPEEDLVLMSSCKNNIIANSTFSWWAAWLNPSPNKTVIAPRKWVGPGYSHLKLDDLYCPGWIII